MTSRGRRTGVALVVIGALLATGGVAVALRGEGPAAPPDVPIAHVGRVPDGPAAVEPTNGRQRRAGVTLPVRSRLVVHGVTAAIGRVRVVDHELQIPRDPRGVGWWRGSATPGSHTGTVVIAGHVNYSGVTGALAVVPRLRPGERVMIAEVHRRITYRVTGVRTYRKRTGLPAGIFARGGRSRLVLITCGGAFDEVSGNYVDNVVAYAVPVRGSTASVPAQ